MVPSSFIYGISQGAEPASVFRGPLSGLSKRGGPITQPTGADNPGGRDVGRDGRQCQLTAFDKMP